MNKQLYNQRAIEHLAHAKILFEQADYVQAGEKIWGALSALVNSKAVGNNDLKMVEDKRISFNRLFGLYSTRTPGLHVKMHALQLNNSNEVFDAIFGLHKFFYGGQRYSDGQCKRYMPFFIELLENL